MSTPLTEPTAPPAAALPRYRGFRGAAIQGLVAFVCIGLVGGLGGLALKFIDGDPNGWAPHFFARFTLLGLALGGGGALCVWMCGGTRQSLFQVSWHKGDISASLGALAGVILAGSLSANWDSTDTPRPNRPHPWVGEPVEIAGPTVNGEPFNLAEHRGHVVLIDFWATWCGPCLAELPHVRDAYERYHADGFDVVSVSLDYNRPALDRFLAKQPTPWPQIYFDEEGSRGWDSPLAKRYDIHSIPAMFVIDREGKLAARGVRGGLIATAVADALGRSRPIGERLWQLFTWLINGAMASPWWLLLACGWGAALIAGLIEMFVRRAFARTPASVVG